MLESITKDTMARETEAKSEDLLEGLQDESPSRAPEGPPPEKSHQPPREDASAVDMELAIESLRSFRTGARPQARKHPIIQKLAEVNKELWIILSLLVIAALMNYLVTAQRMVLGFYTLPTLFSAYFFGRRHATLTAFASVGMVAFLAHMKPDLFTGIVSSTLMSDRVYDLFAWGGMLIITGYTMGTLYERHESKVKELQTTYHGLLHILRHFISKDKYTENHSYRVSIYSAKIASYLGLSRERIEDVRAAALLHDIGKLDISRQLLYKAAQLSHQEYVGIQRHVDKGASLLEPIGGPLHRIIPIILAHHDRYDGSGYTPQSGEEIPLEARIIAVADVYDALTSDRPYRKAMAPLDAKDNILKGAGKEFDPKVVGAFLQAFQKGEMEVPEIYL
jgi:putative nucleotidyltransferase with HDIG domain